MSFTPHRKEKDTAHNQHLMHSTNDLFKKTRALSQTLLSRSGKVSLHGQGTIPFRVLQAQAQYLRRSTRAHVHIPVISCLFIKVCREKNIKQVNQGLSVLSELNLDSDIHSRIWSVYSNLSSGRVTQNWEQGISLHSLTHHP